MEGQEQRPRSGERDERKGAQDAIIQSILAGGGSYSDAAGESGVSARTVRRRMAEESFAREVAVLRAERVGQVTSHLVELSMLSVEVLRSCLEDEEPSVRLRAAGMVLVHMTKLRGEHDHDMRLASIERRLDESQRGDEDPQVEGG